MPKLQIGTEGQNGADRSKSKKLSNIRALVVDDDPPMRLLIREVLWSAGIVSVSESESADGLGPFLTEKFDVLLIDLSQPPGLDSSCGADLTRKIRKSGLNQNTTVILISDDQRPSVTAEGFRAGANFVVYKPIDRAHLASLIRATQGTIENEKRRFRRVPVQRKIRIKSTMATIEGETIDISLNGALVRVPRTFPIRSAIEISIYLLGDGAPVVGMGTVSRIDGYNQMGIHFERLSVEESRRMQDCLLSLMPE